MKNCLNILLFLSQFHFPQHFTSIKLQVSSVINLLLSVIWILIMCKDVCKMLHPHTYSSFYSNKTNSSRLMSFINVWCIDSTTEVSDWSIFDSWFICQNRDREYSETYWSISLNWCQSKLSLKHRRLWFLRNFNPVIYFCSNLDSIKLLYLQ